MSKQLRKLELTREESFVLQTIINGGLQNKSFIVAVGSGELPKELGMEGREEYVEVLNTLQDKLDNVIKTGQKYHWCVQCYSQGDRICTCDEIIEQED